MDTTTQEIPLDAITRDPNQPRKEFDEKKLGELADSIRLYGVLAPIMVRPAKAAGVVVRDRFIVVSGERRWLASGKAKRDKIPCVVRDVGDNEVLAIQLAENDRRVDLRALERSGAHQQMVKRGMSVEQIAEATGDGPATVRDSLKLQDLVPEVRRAWGLGQLDYSKALLIAKVPAQVQPAALADALEENVDGEVMSFRQLKDHVYRTYLLELKKAPFAIADAQLVPAVGSCNNCPSRTGAQPDFFADLKADFCLNRVCYQGKSDAHLAAAEVAGTKVLSNSESAEVFRYGSSRPAYDAEYVLADEKPHGAKKSYGGMVDKKDLVLAKDPNGKVVELVARESLPKEKGEDKPKRGEEELKLDREHEIRTDVAKNARGFLLAAVESSNGNDVAWMRACLAAMISSARSGALVEVRKRRGWAKDFDILAEVADVRDAATLRGLLFDVAFAERLSPWRHATGYPEAMVEACKLLKVDLKDLSKSVKKTIETEHATKAKKLATVKEVVEAKRPRAKVVKDLLDLSAAVKGKHANKAQREKFRKLADEAGLSKKSQTSADPGKTASGKKRRLPIQDVA